MSKFIATKVENDEIITNNTPHSIAAGIIYYISQKCNLNFTKQNIKAICGVNEVTINKCYQKLDAYHMGLMPLAIQQKYS